MDNKSEIRKLFPITKRYIYLDHSAVAPVSLRAVEASNNFLKEASIKAGFAYEEWVGKIEKVRENFAKLIRSEAEEIAFVRNTSHGIKLCYRKGVFTAVSIKSRPPCLVVKRHGIC